jgi:hypothetical protein
MLGAKAAQAACPAAAGSLYRYDHAGLHSRAIAPSGATESDLMPCSPVFRAGSVLARQFAADAKAGGNGAAATGADAQQVRAPPTGFSRIAAIAAHTTRRLRAASPPHRCASHQPHPCRTCTHPPPAGAAKRAPADRDRIRRPRLCRQRGVRGGPEDGSGRGFGHPFRCVCVGGGL